MAEGENLRLEICVVEVFGADGASMPVGTDKFADARAWIVEVGRIHYCILLCTDDVCHGADVRVVRGEVHNGFNLSGKAAVKAVGDALDE